MLIKSNQEVIQMKIQTSKESGKDVERPHIAEGLYEAKLKEVKEISDGQYGKRVAFLFSLNLDGKEIQVSHICYLPEVATPDNKFGKVLQALSCDLGAEIEVDSLIGNSARVMVEDYSYEEEQDGKKVEKTASSISKVKPLVETKKVE